jgi:photosystem II stability/assembly factor-like uncharacterized protein
LFCVFYVLASQISFAQVLQKPSVTEISTLPDWAQTMYGPNPNVFDVDSLFAAHYSVHPFQKNYHTQYYKRWRKSVARYIDLKGFVVAPTVFQEEQKDEDYREKLATSGQPETNPNWAVVGPYQVYADATTPANEQTNVYAIDQCAAAPNIMYCGTEPGEVYKSTDTAATWACVTLNENFYGGVSAIEVSPTNPNLVFAGSGAVVKRSADGGVTWTTVLTANSLNANEILIINANPQIVLVAGDAGLYRSTDAGQTFTQILTDKVFDVKLKPGNSNTIYMVKDNPTLQICQFFRSTNRGATWALQSTGWYTSADPARYNGGARIAVTPADTNRVYAYLIGESKPNDHGFIGVYKSTNGGASWTLPNGPVGGPYTAAHPNLAIGYPAWTYHQGFYNCGLMVSATDADKILVGGLNLWRSNDGGQTYTPVAGYVGGNLSMHVDMQDLRRVGNKHWVTTDGGIYTSSDFFATTATPKNAGIRGSDYWGFGSGWNDDVLVGGLYHNGNIAYHENYGAGKFLALGGGEAPTGYVNPGNNTKTYYSDIGGVYLPATLGGTLGSFSMGMSPNESYYAAESSEMEFYPSCYNIAFLGNANKLWKTTDGGASYTLVYAFGSNVNNHVKYIELSRSNKQVMYLNQQPQFGGNGILWKTTDGGSTWATLPLPAGNSRRMLLSLDMTDENTLWLCYPEGADGAKIYKTTNGGATWANLTTPLLNDEYATAIVAIPNSNGGVYYCSQRTVFYRNNAQSNWQIINNSLPAYFNSNIAKPFFRDGKMRIASYGKGIWESELVDQPAQPIAQIMVDKLQQEVICQNDSFYFNDYSVLNHTNATWQWTFQNGNPGTSSLRNPAVYFSAPGTYQATLTVTDGNNQSDSDTLNVTVQAYTPPTLLQEGFEAGFPPQGAAIVNPQNDAQWSLTTTAGGFGNSSNSAYFNNYVYDSQGAWDDLRLSFNNTFPLSNKLIFDVAHAPYGGQYIDTLQVLASTDCGATFTQLYKKWGNTLATAPYNTSEFFPANNEWRTDTVDLTPFGGVPHVVIAFRNIGLWGNNIFIDNINLKASGLQITELASRQFGVYPNPVLATGVLTVFNAAQEEVTLRLYNANGQIVAKQTLNATSKINLTDLRLAPGVYVVNLHGETRIENYKLVVE